MKRRHANPFSDASQASSTSTGSPVSQTTFKEPTIASGGMVVKASEPVLAQLRCCRGSCGCCACNRSTRFWTCRCCCGLNNLCRARDPVTRLMRRRGGARTAIREERGRRPLGRSADLLESPTSAHVPSLLLELGGSSMRRWDVLGLLGGAAVCARRSMRRIVCFRTVTR
jgi:hypothetical protein